MQRGGHFMTAPGEFALRCIALCCELTRLIAVRGGLRLVNRPNKICVALRNGANHGAAYHIDAGC